MDKKFNKSDSINKDDYYIFYNLLTRNFVYLQGSKITQVEYAYSNDTLLDLVSIKGKPNYILHWNYYDCCGDGKFYNEETIRTFIQYIIKKFYSYKQLRDSIVLHVYPEFIANADGKRCGAFINIDFKVNDPLKLLLLIESLEVIDKI